MIDSAEIAGLMNDSHSNKNWDTTKRPCPAFIPETYQVYCIARVRKVLRKR